MDTITIYCVNDGKEYSLPEGSRLSSIAPKTIMGKDGKEYPVLAALADHELKDLNFPPVIRRAGAATFARSASCCSGPCVSFSRRRP